MPWRNINPYSAKHVFSRFQFVLLADQIILTQFKKMWVIVIN